jgi:hypothetical protein
MSTINLIKAEDIKTSSGLKNKDENSDLEGSESRFFYGERQNSTKSV